MAGKAEIRKMVLQSREKLNQAERLSKSKEIYRTVLSLPEYGTSQTVMTYLNYKDEAETTRIAQDTLRRGKRLIIPLCDPSTCEIIPCEILDLSRDLHPGMWGIREPHPEKRRPVSPKEIDLVLVPGVAFDTRGNRIGFGKGYYDRLLPELRKDARTVGLAFSCQIVEKIKAEEHDVKISLLVTENGVIYPT